MKLRLTLGSAGVAVGVVLVAVLAFGGAATATSSRPQRHATCGPTRLQNNSVAAARVLSYPWGCSPFAAVEGFTQATHPGTGVYCLQVLGIRSSRRQAIVSPDYGDSLVNPAVVETGYGFGGLACPTDWYRVVTMDTSGNLVNGVVFDIVVT